MKRPAWLDRLLRRTRGAENAARPLAAQLDNPYTPACGAPRRFAVWVRQQEKAPPPHGGGGRQPHK